MELKKLPYWKPVQKWLADRYGTDADAIRRRVEENYNLYLSEIPDYGGKKNGHARAIYGGLLIFALYPALPDQPSVSELQSFVQNLILQVMRDNQDTARLDTGIYYKGDHPFA